VKRRSLRHEAHGAAARQAATARIERALRALGGVATLGDLIMATGLPRRAVEAALGALMAEEWIQIVVSESAVLVYRLHERGAADVRQGAADVRRGANDARRAKTTRRSEASADTPGFDRKTLRLIRARGGVVSIAELVEHTGLTVWEAEREAQRLASLYGGEPHPSWDGHVVYAFPDLVESAHGSFSVREPRPAWARAEAPVTVPVWPASASARAQRAAAGAAALAAASVTWFSFVPPDPLGRALVLASVAGISAGAAFVLARFAAGRIRRHPAARVRDAEAIRRYALGFVFETALRGKGVVSVGRTAEHLERRFGGRRVARSTVKRALRQLALEFDATVTYFGGETFFGFRNVKRQFLASHVVRVRLGLERKASGRILFDSGDSALAAAERELEEFDRALRDAEHGYDEADATRTRTSRPRSPRLQRRRKAGIFPPIGRHEPAHGENQVDERSEGEVR